MNLSLTNGRKRIETNSLLRWRYAANSSCLTVRLSGDSSVNPPITIESIGL